MKTDKRTTRRNTGSPRKKRAQEGFFRRHAIGVMIFCVAFVILAGGAVYMCMEGYNGKEDTYIHVEEGMTPAQLRDRLQSQLGASMGYRVYMLWRLQGGNIESSKGLYRIEPGRSAFMAARIIAKGRRTPVKVTFNNVRSVGDLSRIVAARMEFTAQEFRDAAEKVLSIEGYKPEEFPAAFIPDTYEFFPHTDAEKVVRRLLKARNSFWNDERVAKAEKLGLTPIEVTTLASIVEEESARPSEHPQIARLYLNRLAKHMRLQADPTVKFALGDPTIRRISTDMLKTPSPYNTYTVQGLPPGPIRIPDPRTIDAVLNAPEHPYLYMCARADFSGYHDFAVDYNEHRKNAEKYRAELDKRDIH